MHQSRVELDWIERRGIMARAKPRLISCHTRACIAVVFQILRARVLFMSYMYGHDHARARIDKIGFYLANCLRERERNSTVYDGG